MVRARSEAFPAAVALVAVPVSACGAAASQTSWKGLFQEYVNSTHVKNDWSDGEGGTSGDRAANFASRGTPFERSVLVRRRNGALELITRLRARAARRRTAEVRP